MPSYCGQSNFALTVRNCFSLGALRGVDGGFLLGVMSSHTLNAGKIYFPAGTPDPADIAEGMVDLAGSIRREVAEETGLDPEHYEAEDGWTCVLTDTHIAQIKLLHARESAAALRARILANLARETEPELADIRIARGPPDLDPMMPPFVTASGYPAKPHGTNSEGLRRSGFAPSDITAIRRAYKALYRNKLSLDEARAAIAAEAGKVPALGIMAKFLETPGRGIIR